MITFLSVHVVTYVPPQKKMLTEPCFHKSMCLHLAGGGGGTARQLWASLWA